MPKDPKIRQRRNKSSSRALLRVEVSPFIRAPHFPKCSDQRGWHDMARRWWHEVWTSPMHFEFVRGDLPSLFRLVVLVNSFWWDGKLDVAKEIRLMEREFGLTPLSRRRLEWSVAQAEEAKDRHEHKRSKRGLILDADPREVLE
jgi:hypothetical protein